jgi:flagellar hook protein FlgE
MQIGLGVGTGSISPNFSQGGVESTGIATNVAIQGTGFFVVGDTAHRTYTRAGNFSFDANGTLVTTDGQPVQGYTVIDPVTGKISTTGQPGSIVIPPGVLRSPVPSTKIGTMSNLDSRATNGSTFAASVQVYDSLGEPHVATVTFTKTGVGAWNYAGHRAWRRSHRRYRRAVFSGDRNAGFDSLGKLTAVNGGAPADVTITSPAWKNGAAAVNFSWDLVDANGVASLTQFAANSATSSVTQNGSPTGAVTSIISINQTGELVASFGVGRTVVVGQLALGVLQQSAGAGEGRHQRLQRERSVWQSEHRRRRQRRPRIAHWQFARAVERGHGSGIHADDSGAARLSGEFEEHHGRRRTAARYAQPQAVTRE